MIDDHTKGLSQSYFLKKTSLTHRLPHPPHPSRWRVWFENEGVFTSVKRMRTLMPLTWHGMYPNAATLELRGAWCYPVMMTNDNQYVDPDPGWMGFFLRAIGVMIYVSLVRSGALELVRRRVRRRVRYSLRACLPTGTAGVCWPTRRLVGRPPPAAAAAVTVPLAVARGVEKPESSPSQVENEGAVFKSSSTQVSVSSAGLARGPGAAAVTVSESLELFAGAAPALPGPGP
jgi:hypothetical protein